jgi:hypothetical protein
MAVFPVLTNLGMGMCCSISFGFVTFENLGVPGLVGLGLVGVFIGLIIAGGSYFMRVPFWLPVLASLFAYGLGFVLLGILGTASLPLWKPALSAIPPFLGPAIFGVLLTLFGSFVGLLPSVLWVIAKEELSAK